jgi:hypothetical protein
MAFMITQEKPRCFVEEGYDNAKIKGRIAAKEWAVQKIRGRTLAQLQLGHGILCRYGIIVG